MEEAPTMTVEQKQRALRLRRSDTERIYRKFIAEGGIPAPGLGKGKEPHDKWCECHSRYPCPIDKELDRLNAE